MYVTNTGSEPLKLYTIYAGPDHLEGTVHKTHQDAIEDPNEQTLNRSLVFVYEMYYELIQNRIYFSFIPYKKILI